MDNENTQIKAAIIELADAIERGETRGLGETIRNLLGGYQFEESQPNRSHFVCDCGKCRAVRAGENKGDDGVN